MLNPIIKKANNSEVTLVVWPKAPDIIVFNMFSDIWDTEIAPKHPIAIYRETVIKDDPHITEVIEKYKINLVSKRNWKCSINERAREGEY